MAANDTVDHFHNWIMVDRCLKLFEILTTIENIFKSKKS
jgi:hypothetical protein